MTRFFLVRHAETVWQAENRYAGRSDIPLTDHGNTQTEHLVMRAQGLQLDAVYSSTQMRAIHTAAPVANAVKLPLATDARLCEVAFGTGEGMTRSEMEIAFPTEFHAFMAHPATVPLPGGESGKEAVARATPVLEELMSKHPNGRVFVVTHSTLIRLLLTHWLGLDADRYRTLLPYVDNCGLTEIELAPSADIKIFCYNSRV